ncbi:MAG: glycosyl transferase family 28 [Stappia sp.]|uniref:polysaccharide deacetylase family protein n=1 Tax=Stappia sp. TaxID=1870903 RepID=UPI000C62309E|nr:polysaccharide deacetylase family protein [Stappia sp.]MAA98648.1 glycosyl transferase family 28 [Stappia sp.]MBM20523.1 glycosyl transferase family 28 [Stappia sp.]
MSDTGFEVFRDGLLRHLDWFAERGRSIPVWWRDDDAIEPSAPLERLIGIANAHGCEVALAVIPHDATQALAERIAAEPFVSVLQHGYRHRNYQDKARGEKAAEFGRARDVDEAIGELAQGNARLKALYAEKFVPVMVPPWNRITTAITARLAEAGLSGVSTFTQFHPRDRRHVQTHIDMIKWKKDRRFIGWPQAALRFDYQLARRRTNPDEPLGLLSHHLAQDDASFEFLDRTLAVMKAHPGARFARIRDLLAG